MKLKTFQEVETYLAKNKRKMSLLMGNGFSMAYDRGIFSYNALYEFLTSKDDELLNKLFGAIKTKNFELIMQQLETTMALLEAFGSEAKLKAEIKSANNKLKSGLLDSIQKLHPEHVYKIPEAKSLACANVLSRFIDCGGHIFTTNYDLLLYWVLMSQNVNNPIDGFGRELENPNEILQGEETKLSELRWGLNKKDQNVHYLHGALHLFDTGPYVVKEQYNNNGFLLENIKARLDNSEYPIFVTAGNGAEKLNHIRHNRYLSYCYDRLSEVGGSLVTFGFNFGQYDEHIIDAINKAAKQKVENKLWSIYVGVYSEADYEHIKSIENKFKVKVNIFDAKTVPVWNTI